MEKYINYTFYEETGKHIAIIYENTPKEILEEFKKVYDEVKYKEQGKCTHWCNGSTSVSKTESKSSSLLWYAK